MKKVIPLRIVVVSLVAFFSSCVADPEISPEPAAKSDPYAVSLEEALDGMYDLMDVLYPKTRTTGRRIAGAETFEPRQAQTRAADLRQEVYIVNFEDGKGFAVLGATRATDPVICITEDGSLTAEDLEEAERELLAGPEEGDQAAWMTYEEIHNTGYGPEGNPEPFDITDYNSDRDEDEEPGEDTGDFLAGVSPSDITSHMVYKLVVSKRPDDLDAIGGSGGGGAPTPITTTTGPWVDSEKTGPFIRTDWHQGAPFNDNCPVKGGDNAPAGCVAIALLQIIAYNEKPSPSFFGATSTWAELKSYNTTEFYKLSSEKRNRISQDLAKITRAIGKGVCMNYGEDGSGTTSAAAKRYLKRKLNYSGVNKYESYKEAAILSMIDNRRPVYISGTYNWTKGHAWIIDGFLTQKQTATTTSKSTGKVTNTSTRYRSFVHYEFGWGGNFCNGYYLFGKKNVDLRDGPIVSDSTEDVYIGEKTNEYNREYNSWFRTVVYK